MRREALAHLVLEAANVLIAKLPIDDFVDTERVRIGAVIHDAGKALFQNELYEPGAKHESAGRQALLELGVSDRYAIICETHDDYARR